MAEKDPKDSRLTRRLIIARVARGTGLAVAAVAGAVILAPSEAGAQRNVTDSDPNDGAGRGRGGGSSTGYTDRDPSDGPGRGRR